MSRFSSLALGILTIVSALASAGTISSCLAKSDTVICYSGRRCSGGQICAIDQDVCVDENGCGNGHIDEGEVCDDGNIIEGDGCSRDCKSREICGNGILDTVKREECDDGNLIDGDGCGHDCKTESCGNGIVNTGEECDHASFGPGNPDGNSNNNDCRADCQFNRCGDGFVDTQAGSRHEDCDGGHLTMDSHNQLIPTPTETKDCNIDCTASSCGDGKINRHSILPGAPGPEQCDNGADNNDNADCTTTCQLNVCGDGFQDMQAGSRHPEQCDNGIGNNDNTDCTTTCKRNVCGDGHRDTLGPLHFEACDGDDFGGDTCATVMPFMPDGQLRCNMDCTLDTSHCHP